MALVAMLGLAGSAAAADDGPASDAGLTALAQRSLLTAPAIEGQDKSRVRLKVTYTAARQQLTTDYVSGYIPANDVEMEDQQQWVGNSLMFRLEPAQPVRSIVFLYAGKPLSHYFPESFPPGER
ncbi:hypothetical protein [Stenotrophomonas sp.]|uniref:hypothetical protein n=1 Tax=Stenotrophomonas sp. TaxID=69392 RepID=UPI002FC5B217